MRNLIIILLFLFFPFFVNGQTQDNAPQKQEEQEQDVKVLEYTSKPDKVTFATPVKLNLVLPEPAVFDKETASQKDFEVLSVEPQKNNFLSLDVTILPLNLRVSTLTALGFTTSTGAKFKTEPVEMEILEISTKKPMKDLIDIRGPFRPFNLFMFLLILLAVGVVIYIIVYFMRRKKQPEQLHLTPYEKQERPMHEIALSQLDILIQSDLWIQNKYKLYYSEISDIVRQFLSARFGFEAEKMTARELFKKLKTIPDFKFDFNTLQKFQQEIILVKFAKFIPTLKERDIALKTARDIILENKETDLSRYQNNKTGGNA